MKKIKLEIGLIPEILGVAALVISLYYVHNLFTATGVMIAMIFTSSVAEKALNKSGKNVFSKNLHGHYMKLRVKPSNPKTKAQMSSRKAFGAISSRWKGLTTFERGEWNSYASIHWTSNKLGFKRALSGFHWYMKVNTPLYYMGKEMLKRAPKDLYQAYPARYGEFKAEYDTETHEVKKLTVDYTVDDTNDNIVFEIFISQAESKGKTSWRSAHYKYGTCLPRETMPTGTLDLTEAVLRVVNPMPNEIIRKKIFFKIRQVNVEFGQFEEWEVLSWDM